MIFYMNFYIQHIRKQSTLDTQRSLTYDKAKSSAYVLAKRGISARCWSWYFRIGVSDLPSGPTLKRVAE